MKAIQLQSQSILPSKVVCIGRNYVEHIAELNNEMPEQMVVFIKPNSAIAQAIVIDADQSVHYEGEIVLLIQAGKIAAVGFGLDLTKRELQSKLKEKGLPWERAKAFDGAAVLSDFVPFDGDPADLHMSLAINSALVQQGGCKHMLYPPENILQELQTFLTLEDGDLIMTGTPKGVGALNEGDQFVGKVFYKEQLLLEVQWQVRQQ